MNKSYCLRPFNHVYSDSAGRYRLCCHSKVFNNPLGKYNSNTDFPMDVFFSEEMEEIRNMMMSGEKVDACRKCYALEKQGAYSPRLTKTKKMIAHPEPHSVQIKLRIFGNNCNLSCYMCTPYNSSTRIKEFKELEIDYREYDFNHVDFLAKPKKGHFEGMLQNVLDNIEYISSIYITGGEPFLLPRHYDFLNRIPEKYAEHINIRYDTNMTVLEYKGKSIFETLKKFKSFGFMVSADHYGEKLSYIRYPIDVNQFERNLEYIQTKYNNAIMRIGCTVSMLNVEDLDDILPYYENKFGIENKGYTSAVINPKPLSIQNHKDKEHLIKKYSSYEMDPDKIIISRLKQPQDLTQWNKGIEYLKILDQHRKTDYTKLWDYEKVELLDVVNI